MIKRQKKGYVMPHDYNIEKLVMTSGNEELDNQALTFATQRTMSYRLQAMLIEAVIFGNSLK